MIRTFGRWLLAGSLAFAGVAHFVATDSFTRLIPPWMPADTGIVWITGAMEIGFAVALIAVPVGMWRRRVGWALAAFLALVFVGNIYQAVADVDAFGLDTDVERWGRLVFQPVLMAWALWACDAFAQTPEAGGFPPG
jgi:uncharacterized membrane protein